MIVKHAASKYAKSSSIVVSETTGHVTGVRMILSEDALAEICEALADQRDPFGTEPSSREQWLSNALHNLQHYNRQEQTR